MTLTTENLGKRFHREWIFRNFNYSFEPGTYAITGPNGSGKSTLLQMLWGQLPPSAGNIQYRLDHQPVPIEEVYKHLVIAAPYMDLPEEFTVKEVVKFHFSFKRIRDRLALKDLLDLFELTHAAEKNVGQLSSGMKQRLKLGLAFFSEADMVFLDEPTTNLDKESIQWYGDHLVPLLAKCSVFIATNLEDECPSGAKKINLPDYR